MEWKGFGGALSPFLCLHTGPRPPVSVLPRIPGLVPGCSPGGFPRGVGRGAGPRLGEDWKKGPETGTAWRQSREWAFHLESRTWNRPPTPHTPHRLSAVPPAGQVGLGWPQAELLKPPALIPSASQHGCACSFRPSKTLAKKNKENDLSAVIYTVNLLWSDFFPSPACSNLLRKIK